MQKILNMLTRETKKIYEHKIGDKLGLKGYKKNGRLKIEKRKGTAGYAYPSAGT